MTPVNASTASVRGAARVSRERNWRVTHVRSAKPCGVQRTHAHAGSRTRVTSMGGLYDAATLRAPMPAVGPPSGEIWTFVGKSSAAGGNTTPAHVCCQTGTCPNAFNVDMRATVELGWGNSRVRRSARKRRRRTRVGATRSRNFREDRRASKHAPTCAQTAVWRSLLCVTLRNFKSWQHPEVFPGGPPPQY